MVRTVQVKGYSHILTDSARRTIYTSTGPANAKAPLCTGKCTSVWHPVLVRTGHLAAPGTLGVRLGSLPRPGGMHQLAVNGHRAYTFVGDTRPGQIAGDRFITGGAAGRTYTWRAVRVAKDAPATVPFTSK